MKEQITGLVLNVIGIIISSIIMFIGYLLKKSISDRLDNVDTKLQKIDDGMTSMKIEIVRDYVPKSEYIESQKDMRSDIRALEKQINDLGKAS